MFVLKFCSKNHQKLASNKGWVVETEKGLGVRHKDVCHLLKAWSNIPKEAKTDIVIPVSSVPVKEAHHACEPVLNHNASVLIPNYIISAL
jgi:hypothetical protein